jgi:hypothetical protein
VFAQVDISSIRFWDLNSVEMMIPERIYLLTPTVEEDNFMPGEGWIFGPAENEKYEDGRVVLFTNGDETMLNREDLQGNKNVAMEVTFLPRDMRGPSSLIWIIGGEMNTAAQYLAFEYLPESGDWNIFEIENNVWNKRGTGETQTTPVDNIGRIMVIVDGKMVSAFYNDTFIGSATCGFVATGRGYYLKIRGFNVPYAQVDISNLKFWNLDQ